MADRGQRTRIVIGAAQAEVSLLKSSAPPRDAQYETRRDVSPAAAGPGPAWPDEGPAPTGETDTTAVEPGDPLGLEDEAPREQTWAPVASSTVRRGVTLESGEWVDLTDAL